MRRFPVPWTVWTMFALALAGCVLLFLRKWPFLSDAEKFCRVAELSGCPPTARSAWEDDCKLAWLERSMWNMGSLIQRRQPGDPQGRALLRRWTSARGLNSCPEADAVEREDDLRLICNFLSDCDEQRQGNMRCRAEALRTPWGKDLLKQLLAIQSIQGRADHLKSVAAEWAECRAATPDDKDATQRWPAERARDSGDDDIAPGEIAVTNGAPAVEGELDGVMVIRAMGPGLRRIAECLVPLRPTNHVRHGRITLRWKITGKGKAARIESDDEDIAEPKVIHCIRDVIASVDFPHTHGGAEVVYPLKFGIGGEKSGADTQ